MPRRWSERDDCRRYLSLPLSALELRLRSLCVRFFLRAAHPPVVENANVAKVTSHL